MDIIAPDKNLFVRHKCGQCGTHFYSDPQYRYKRYVVDRTKYFCCRECMDKYTGYKGDGDSSKTVILEKDKPVIRNLYFESGWSMEEISDHLGYTFKTIESYCLRLIDEYPL